MTKTTKVTCKRCKGKGFGTWREQQGRCYGCEGSGFKVKLSDDDRVKVTQLIIEQTKEKIEKDAAFVKKELELVVEAWGSDDDQVPVLEDRLTKMRAAWLEANDYVSPRTVTSDWLRKLS